MSFRPYVVCKQLPQLSTACNTAPLALSHISCNKLHVLCGNWVLDRPVDLHGSPDTALCEILNIIREQAELEHCHSKKKKAFQNSSAEFSVLLERSLTCMQGLLGLQ